MAELARVVCDAVDNWYTIHAVAGSTAGGGAANSGALCVLLSVQLHCFHLRVVHV